MFTFKDYGSTSFITGMRAYAAMAILIAHTGSSWLSPVAQGALSDMLGQGVSVFFVISGFAVSQSYYQEKWFPSYILKRYFRIAPLYYFWLLIAIATSTTSTGWQDKNGVDVDFYNVIMHVAFLSDFDYKIAPTLLGVDWTLPIEMFWYLAIPPILYWADNLKRTMIAVLISAVVYQICMMNWTPFQLSPEEAAYAIKWSPFPYGLGFMLGMLAFRLRQNFDNLAHYSGPVLIFVLVSFFCFLCAPKSVITPLKFPYVCFATFLVILFGATSNSLCRYVFCNRLSMVIGTLSFGLYLSHQFVINFVEHVNQIDNELVRVFVVSVISLCISFITYRLIEQPSISLAKKLIPR